MSAEHLLMSENGSFVRNITNLESCINNTDKNVNHSLFDNENVTSLAVIADYSASVSDWLWTIMSPIIFCFGVVGNVLTLCVIRRLGLSKQPTLMFVCVLAVNDSVVLMTGLPRYWIVYAFDYDIKTISNATCKLYYFVIYTAMQYSSWILVGFTFERIIKIYFPFKYRRFFTSTKVVIGLSITLFLLILVNVHFFFTNGINDFTEGECSSLTPAFLYFDEYYTVYIDFALLSAVPFIIMFICNIFIVRILLEIQRNRATMMHDAALKRTNRVSVKMTKMLVVCTFYFLVATAPVSIYFIVESYTLLGYEEAGNEDAVERMDIAWCVTYLMQYSNYSVNFYLYTAMNDSFLTEMRSLLRCKPSLRQMKIYSMQHQQRQNTVSVGKSNDSVSDVNDM